MLHRLEIENFYSIRDRQVIDLVTAGNAPDEPDRLAPLWLGSADRAPKVVTLFGANASGKSNVLKALSFLAWFLRESFRAQPDLWMPFERFYDDEARNSPARLVAHFAAPVDPEQPNGPKCRFAYEVSIGGPKDRPQQVLSEMLKYWPPGAGRQVRLFDRNEAGVVKAGRAFAMKGYRQVLENVLRPNVSVVSTLAQLKHPFATALWRISMLVMTNILIEKQEVDDRAIAHYYKENPKFLDLLN